VITLFRTSGVLLLISVNYVGFQVSGVRIKGSKVQGSEVQGYIKIGSKVLGSTFRVTLSEYPLGVH
jgi:hypothetical protein